MHVTETGDVPDPTSMVGEQAEPSDVVVPHCVVAVVGEPFGLTVPFVLAPELVMFVAANVTTVGAGWSVVKLRTEPRLVPPEFVATTR